MEKSIINRVAQSALVTIDLEEFYSPGERISYDLKDNLYKGMILKEKDFRQFLNSHDWSFYKNKHVAIQCSVDAIIPRWAYMLLTIYMEKVADSVIFGSLEDLELYLFKKSIEKIDLLGYMDKKVIIKGCGKIDVPIAVYVELTRLLKPYVISIMYGEPCSTVPIYKRPVK